MKALRDRVASDLAQVRDSSQRGGGFRANGDAVKPKVATRYDEAESQRHDFQGAQDVKRRIVRK